MTGLHLRSSPPSAARSARCGSCSPFVRIVTFPSSLARRVGSAFVGVLGLLAFALALTWSAPAHAYPTMIKHGYWGCGTCHADPSGGELLTRYGRIQGIELLAMRYGARPPSTASPSAPSNVDSFDSFDTGPTGSSAAKKPPAPAPPSSGEEPSPGWLWGAWDPPEPLLLGGAIRWATLLHPTSEPRFQTFPMQADVFGQLGFGVVRGELSLGISKLTPGSPYARAAQITSNPPTDFNLLSRTHWIGVDLADGAMTLRAGRMNLPFGLRIPEHTMWVRDTTRTDRESSQQHGVALAFTTDAVRGEVMGIAGNYQIHPDRVRERGYSLYVEGRASDRVGLGVSSLVTHAGQDRITFSAGPMTRQAHGVFGRVTALPSLVALGEFDGILMTGRDAGYAGLLQLDFEPIQGLHALGAGEVMDLGKQPGTPGQPNPAEPGIGLPRWGGWIGVDWFFAPQLEFRVDVIDRQKDKLLLFGQLHAYL